MVTLPCAGSKSEIVSGMPFAVLVDADDDELPGLRRMCDARCEDLHQPDALGEESFSSIGYITIFFPAAALGRKPHIVVILR